LVLAANLSEEARGGFPLPTGSVIWSEGEAMAGGTYGPFAVRWWIEPPSPGGTPRG
jgi:glycogen debranching enzyme